MPPPPPKPPVWLDTNVLVKIERGERPDVELEILKIQQDGHEVLIPQCVEHEFVYGQKMGVADAARSQAVLNRLHVHVDTMTNQVSMQQLRMWREEGITNGLLPGDANVVAQVRAGAAARGLRNPVLFTLDKKMKRIGTQTGVGALEPRNIPVKPRPVAEAPAPIPEQPRALPVRTQVQVHPPETPPPTPSVRPPRIDSFGRMRTLGNAFAEGIKGAFSAENIAALIPDMILMLADKAATRAAVRRIQIKFIKEGFAKGVAAGVMGWTMEEVESTLLNRVTAFRVQDLGDPAGTLDRPYILKLAEAYENYAVEVGYTFSSSRLQSWKSAMLRKGFPLLKRYGYDFKFGDNAEALFQYELLDKLAWVLTPTTNAIIEPAIRFDDEPQNDPANDVTPILAGA